MAMVVKLPIFRNIHWRRDDANIALSCVSLRASESGCAKNSCSSSTGVAGSEGYNVKLRPANIVALPFSKILLHLHYFDNILVALSLSSI